MRRAPVQTLPEPRPKFALPVSVEVKAVHRIGVVEAAIEPCDHRLDSTPSAHRGDDGSGQGSGVGPGRLSFVVVLKRGLRQRSTQTGESVVVEATTERAQSRRRSDSPVSASQKAERKYGRTRQRFGGVARSRLPRNSPGALDEAQLMATWPRAPDPTTRALHG